jgi:O-antigen/teichoic acid export membrane protein
VNEKSVYQNSLIIATARISSMGLSLVLIPVLIQTLGLVGFAVWEQLTLFQAISSTFQGVISGTIIWKVSHHFGRRDFRSICRMARIGQFVALAVTLVGAIVLICFKTQIVAKLSIPPEYVASIYKMVVLAGSLVLLGGVNEVLNAVLVGVHQSGAAAIGASCGIIIQNVTGLLLVRQGWGIESLAYGILANFIWTSAFFRIACHKHLGNYGLVPAFPTWNEIVDCHRYGTFLLLGAISMFLREQLDKLVLATLGTAQLVAAYSVASRLAATILMLCSFLYVPVISAAGSLAARGDHSALGELFAKLTWSNAWLVLFFGALLAAAGEASVVLWVGKSVEGTLWFLTLLLIGNAFATVFSGMPSSIFKGTGDIRWELKYIGISVGLNLLLKLILIPSTGPAWAIVASVTSWSVSSLVFFRDAVRFLRLGCGLFKRTWLIIAVAGCSVILTRIIYLNQPSVINRSEAFVRVVSTSSVIVLCFVAAHILFRGWGAAKLIPCAPKSNNAFGKQAGH